MDGAWTSISGAKVPNDQVFLQKGANPSTQNSWQQYTDAQIRSLLFVACALRRAYATIEDIVGHHDVSSQKQDPGPGLPIERVRQRVFGSDARSDNAKNAPTSTSIP